jgi:hypothetical protein
MSGVTNQHIARKRDEALRQQLAEVKSYRIDPASLNTTKPGRTQGLVIGSPKPEPKPIDIPTRKAPEKTTTKKNPLYSYPDELLLLEVRNLMAVLGIQHIPTTQQFDRNGAYMLRVVLIERFGSVFQLSKALGSPTYTQWKVQLKKPQRAETDRDPVDDFAFHVQQAIKAYKALRWDVKQSPEANRAELTKAFADIAKVMMAN